ncbi:MAG TPA: ammonium transporter [Pirellulales bacterium]|jgi:Amt family ammonium transporter
MKKLLWLFCPAVLFLTILIPLQHEASAQEAAEAAIEAAAGPAGTSAEAPAPPHVLDRGDNAWMLMSSALVLAMTTPGLAMFYGGLVRKKNVVSVLMQCMFLMGLMTVLWGTVGYSLCFGGIAAPDAWIGNADHFFMNGLQATWTEGKGSDIPLFPTLNIPWFTHMLFQGMFFIITPALICGAFAERMKFSTMVVFMILWGLLVYCPLCHWVWGGGIFAYGSEHAKTYCAGGALDFAGGTVVHISSGVSALVCALVLGKRTGYGTEPMPPHNLTYTALGAGLLWVGWFGFNAGSALAADGIAASAFTATHFSAGAGCLAWSLMDWIRGGKPTLLGASSGAVAGLVCITPAAGFVQPMPAIAMGLMAGCMCSLTCSVMKHKLGYDDSLDAFGVHGLGGTLGALLTGIFATRAVWDIGKGATLGSLEGGPVLKAQIIATVATWVFAGAVSYVLLKVLDLTMGLRVSRDEELQGLDITQHNEEGYIFV